MTQNLPFWQKAKTKEEWFFPRTRSFDGWKRRIHFFGRVVVYWDYAWWGGKEKFIVRLPNHTEREFLREKEVEDFLQDRGFGGLLDEIVYLFNGDKFRVAEIGNGSSGFAV